MAKVGVESGAIHENSMLASNFPQTSHASTCHPGQDRVTAGIEKPFVT